MKKMIYILGAGIAGLSLARELGKSGIAWQILEKEPKEGLHASGKNAGIVRTYETDPLVRHFAQASLRVYRSEEPSFDPCGLLLKPWEVDYALSAVPQRRFSHGRAEGFFLSDNGCIDPELLLQRLVDDCAATGKIIYGFAAEPIRSGGRIAALQNSQAMARIELTGNDSVVVASGEGAIGHSLQLSRPLGLIAHRRTLYEYANTSLYAGPVEWNEETSCYFRVSRGNLLATAGEQVPQSESQLVEANAPNEKHLQALAAEYSFLTATNLVGWRSCLRVMPPDNRPYCGDDGQIANRYWFAGLGGRGISLAPALASGLAAEIAGTGSDMRWVAALQPARAIADFES